MIKQTDITPCKTYATKVNAERAIEKYISNVEKMADQLKLNLRYLILRTEEGDRWYVLLVGADWATLGAHFHFNVIG